MVRFESDKFAKLSAVRLKNLVPLSKAAKGEPSNSLKYLQAASPSSASLRIEREFKVIESAYETRIPKGNQKHISTFPVHKPKNQLIVFLADISAFMADGWHWRYQAQYLVQCLGRSELYIQAPRGARLPVCQVDDQDARPVLLSSHEYWLPVPGGGGPHRLLLKWHYDLDHDGASRLCLAKPTLKNAVLEAEGGRNIPLWTIHVPSGWRAVASDLTTKRSTEAEQEVDRAAAYLSLNLAIALRSSKPLDDDSARFLKRSQAHFRRLCRHAEQLLAFPNSAGPDYARDRELAVRLAQLRLADEQFASLREAPSLQSRAGARAEIHEETPIISQPIPPGAGTLTYWQVPPQQDCPHVYLEINPSNGIRRRLGWSGLLLATCALAWFSGRFAKIIPKRKRDATI